MATISKYGPLRHLRAEPNQFVLHFQNGRIKRSGAGLAYWFLPLSAALAEVPVEDIATTFVLNERSRDFQALKVQCTFVYRIADPAIACSRVNFSIGADTGSWLQRPLDALATLWAQRALPPARDYLASATLEEALTRGSGAIREALLKAMREDTEIAAMGLALVNIVIDQLAPLADVEKALQTPAREAIQAKADEAIFQRRAQAVEKERAIKENELTTELELERKQELLIKQRGDNALNQVRQSAAAENEKSRGDLERQHAIAEADAKRHAISAQASAEAQRVLAAARLDETAKQHEIWRNTPSHAASGIVMARFAEQIKSIGHLNITPDLLAQHFREWLGNPPEAK